MFTFNCNKKRDINTSLHLSNVYPKYRRFFLETYHTDRWVPSQMFLSLKCLKGLTEGTYTHQNIELPYKYCRIKIRS